MQKVFLSNCKKYLHWFVESVCIILQNVFVLVCKKYFYKLQKVFGFFSKSICISLQKVFPLFQRSQLHVVQCRLSRSSLWKNFGIKRLLVRHFDSQFPPRTLIQKLFEYFTFVTALNITYYPEGSKNITPLELYLLNLLLKEHFQFLFSNFSHADSPSQFQGGSWCLEPKKCKFWCAKDFK